MADAQATGPHQHCPLPGLLSSLPHQHDGVVRWQSPRLPESADNTYNTAKSEPGQPAIRRARLLGKQACNSLRPETRLALLIYIRLLRL